MIPYDSPPQDTESRIPLHFIRTEIAARAGVIATGASTGATFVESIDPLLRFAIAIVGLCVGLATFTFYALAIVEKWRNLRRKDEE